MSQSVLGCVCRLISFYHVGKGGGVIQRKFSESGKRARQAVLLAGYFSWPYRKGALLAVAACENARPQASLARILNANCGTWSAKKRHFATATREWSRRSDLN